MLQILYAFIAHCYCIIIQNVINLYNISTEFMSNKMIILHAYIFSYVLQFQQVVVVLLFVHNYISSV